MLCSCGKGNDNAVGFQINNGILWVLKEQCLPLPVLWECSWSKCILGNERFRDDSGKCVGPRAQKLGTLSSILRNFIHRKLTLTTNLKEPNV